MKYNQLKAELSAAGCFRLRGGGKHEMWFSPITGKRFPVPNHGSKEIPLQPSVTSERIQASIKS